MEQFCAAGEQREHPELTGKPIAVGHDAERGVVSTASYEARRFGVHSAQSIQVAKRLCPQLIIVEPHFQKYKAVSAQLHEILNADEGYSHRHGLSEPSIYHAINVNV